MMQFYHLDDPVVRHDVQMLRGKSIRYVLDYLVSRLKTLEYKNYGAKDTFQTPKQMFSGGTYDCEDSTGYVASVLKALGIPHTIYIGKVLEYPKYDHVWIELPLDGEDYLFETTAPMVLPKKEAEVTYISYWWEVYNGG